MKMTEKKGTRETFEMINYNFSFGSISKCIYIRVYVSFLLSGPKCIIKLTQPSDKWYAMHSDNIPVNKSVQYETKKAKCGITSQL